MRGILIELKNYVLVSIVPIPVRQVVTALDQFILHGFPLLIVYSSVCMSKFIIVCIFVDSLSHVIAIRWPC